jgi:hypothetical protein
MDQAHARAIAQILIERVGVGVVVATSDEAEASRKIGAFAAGNAPWIVAVRMVSEGVDIPRLRVGVYATNTVTDLFFRQAVGRLVRWVGRAHRQAAYMFIPDDARLRTFAAGIAEQRRHSLRRPMDAGSQAPGDETGRAPRENTGADPNERAAGQKGDADGQLSLFAAISAVPLDDQGRRFDGVRIYEDPEGGGEIPDLVASQPANNVSGESQEVGDPRLPLLAEASGAGTALVPLPGPEPAAPAPATIGKPSALARRRHLRELNSAVVADLVHVTGKSHATLNAELNRRTGIRRISEATLRQLERRLELARSLLRRI